MQPLATSGGRIIFNADMRVIGSTKTKMHARLSIAAAAVVALAAASDGAVALAADGAPPQFTLFMLEDSVTTHGAMCLDGSPVGLYFQPGSGLDANNWMVYFQGGGWCYDEAGLLPRPARFAACCPRRLR